MKTTLITGASSGIGRELARIAAADGHNLFLVARREDRLVEIKSELESAHGVTVRYLVKDLTEPSAPREVAEFLTGADIHVSHLVNNAGFGGHGLFHEQELDRNLAMVQLNVTALIALTRLLVPQMVSAGFGRILNVASTAAFLPGPLQAIYYATKAFVVSFSQAIASELHGTGVSSTVLCPGPVRTEFFDAADLTGVNLEKMAASPQKVARVGWNGMQRAKLVVSEQRFLLFLLRFVVPLMPRRLVLKLSRSLQEK